MVHRKEVHPEKVRPCNDPDRCGFTTCWFLHINKPNNADNENQTKADNPRIDSENQSNFKKNPVKPPTSIYSNTVKKSIV